MKPILVITIILLLLGGQAVALYAMGQPLVCNCGHVKIIDGEVRGPDNSQHVFDWYTLFHIASGMIIYLVLSLVLRNKVSFWGMMLFAAIISIGWEIFENSYYIADRYNQTTVYSNYYGDSIINSFVDTVAIIFGFVAAWHLPWVATVFIVIGLELLTGFAIRDSAVLNAIMLIHPFQAVLSWQGG